MTDIPALIVSPDINRRLNKMGLGHKMQRAAQRLSKAIGKMKYLEIMESEEAATRYGAREVTKLMADVVAIYRRVDPKVADDVAAYLTAIVFKEGARSWDLENCAADTSARWG